MHSANSRGSRRRNASTDRGPVGAQRRHEPQQLPVSQSVSRSVPVDHAGRRVWGAASSGSEQEPSAPAVWCSEGEGRAREGTPTTHSKQSNKLVK